MKKLLTAGTLTLLMLTAAVQAQKVKVNYDKKADFSRYKTYSWDVGMPAIQPEVDKYIQDPWCGGVFTTGFFGDLLHGVGVVNNPANIATVPKDLPIFVLSGEKDPVGDNGKGVRQVVEQYRTAGVRHVEMHLYPLARHEILNETNRDEVMKDISAWLDARL